MSKKFLAGTELYAYECMMQELPYAGQSEESDKRKKMLCIGLLKQFMREYGYEEICGRVLGAMDKLLFDACIFLDAVHRDTFWHMYGKLLKNANQKDNGRAAVIYLLSAHKVFQTILENYVLSPGLVLPGMAKGCRDEETYNIYQAAKMTAGMESGLYEEDLFEEGLIDNKILCLIMISKLIEKYGVIECRDRRNRKKKQQYRDKGMRYGKQQNIYVYNRQMVRIKR